MKCAMLMCGQMRTYDRPDLIEQNKRFLFSMFACCDMYICTWKARGFSFSHGAARKADDAEATVTPEEIRRVYESVNGVKVRYIDVIDFDEWVRNLNSEQKQFFHTPHHPKMPYQTSVPIQYLYQRCLMNAGDLSSYDVVIVNRPDVCFAHIMDIPSPIKDNTVYHLQEDGFEKIGFPRGRVHDVFFWGKHDVITTLLKNTFDDLKNNRQEDVELPDQNLHPLDNCRLLAAQAKRCGFCVSNTRFTAHVLRHAMSITDLTNVVNRFRRP